MELREYDRMFQNESSYWWFVARRELVLSLLEPYAPNGWSILDAGCGTGAMAVELQKWGDVTGADSEERALEYCRQRGLRNLALCSVESMPFGDEQFDLITALDLIEHVGDDRAALSEMARCLKPGGILALSVPAYRFMWSGHDLALMHKRRYRASELRAKIEETGLKVEKISYALMLLFLPILIVRLLDRWFRRGEPAATVLPVPIWVNRILIWLQRMEAKLIRNVNLPFGVSIVAIARKN
ncbi:MAG: class I SAM-dependent methyltransferase [Armatimonadetes bacterium]|nr:class I SAM-dependent methyltransferase [Armatimonadota bacterium]